MIELEREAPDLEDLAAYLDGRLAGERKAQVEERLLHDEDYYDVFRENVEYLQEHGPQEVGGGEVVAPAAWWRSWKVIAPLAVAATLVIAFGLWRLILGPSTDQWIAQLDAKAVVSSGTGWDTPGWRVFRGGSASSPIQLDLRRQQELAFRIGVRTVDLRIALAAGDRDAAAGAAQQLKDLTVEDLVLSAISTEYASLKDRIDAGELDSLRKQAAELEQYLAKKGFEGPPADRYRLGAWNEAGRLAALAQDGQMLAGIWRRRQVARGIGQIARHIEVLEAALEQPELDFEAAETAFSQIARELAGRG